MSLYNNNNNNNNNNKLLLIINRQDRQWAYNVTLRLGRAKIVTVEKQ